MFFFGGDFSHAVRKGPLLTPAMELVSGALQAGDDRAARAVEAERDAAERVLDALAQAGAGESPAAALRPRRPGARADGSPTLLELELTEPSMFLVYDGSGGTDVGGNGSRQRSRRR